MSIILLLLLLPLPFPLPLFRRPIRRRKKRTNPTNQVVNDKYAHPKSQSQGDQGKHRHSQKQLLRHWQISTTHGTVHIVAYKGSKLLLHLLKVHRRFAGRTVAPVIGFEQRSFAAVVVVDDLLLLMIIMMIIIGSWMVVEVFELSVLHYYCYSEAVDWDSEEITPMEEQQFEDLIRE
uniref:Transmembrane protein n=1 Tax=Opuntia streptacantha TaxID=393608 RepID=A0A7C9AU82_OPUST